MTPGTKLRLGNACFADGWFHAKPRRREGKRTSLCWVLGQASRGRESAGALTFAKVVISAVHPGTSVPGSLSDGDIAI